MTIHKKFRSSNIIMDNKILHKKLELYEKFFKDLHDLEALERPTNSLENSILIENNKVKSNLSESFLVIDHGKKLEELPIKERTVINEQDNLHNYKKTKEYVEKTNYVYSIAKYVVGIGQWVVLL